MNYISLVFGIILLIVVYAEILLTTLSSTGTGIVTNHLTKSIWRFFFFLSGKRGRNPLLNYAILFIILGILLFWITAIWLGNYLIIRSDPMSVVNSETGIAANEIEKLYYTGYTLSTLGVGDFVANGGFWQFYTIIMSLSGLTVITMSITYLLPVLNSEILKKKISVKISALGSSPQQIVLNAWNGKDFSLVKNSFQSIADMIFEIGISFLAYPVIHYSHSNNLKENLEINIVTLDEAVTILEEYVDQGAMEKSLHIMELRKALSHFVEVVDEMFISKKDEAPNPNYNSFVRANSFPFKVSQADLSERRKVLLALLHDCGFKWDDIYRDKD